MAAIFDRIQTNQTQFRMHYINEKCMPHDTYLPRFMSDVF